MAMSLKGMGFTNVILMGDSGGNQGAMKEVASTLDEKYKGSGTRFYFIPEYYDYASAQKYLQSNGVPEQIEIGASLADAGPAFTVKANRSWTINIKTTNASTWTYVGSNGGSKPISDLTWSNAAAGTFVGISSVDAIFTSGASATNGAAPQVFFKTVWAAGFTQPSNAPGSYSLPVVFTLSAT
jgi:hypothetical protein